MNEATTRRCAGLFGVIASLLIIVQVPLYFLYSGAPPDWNVLTRSLLGITGCTLYAVFFVGLRHVIERAAPGAALPAAVVQAAGLLWVAMVFVPQSMEAGAAISVDHDIDTTTEGPFAAAQYLMQGAISRLLMALFLVALGFAVRRYGALPRWVGTSAYVLAVVNAAFVPALFFGDDAAQFYSAQGWGTTATMGAVWSIWTLLTGIATVRSARRAATPPTGRAPAASYA